jgi:hypothetical protein
MKSALQRLYGRKNGLDNRYEKSVSENKTENDIIETTTQHTMNDDLMQSAETDVSTHTVPSEEEIQEYTNETFSKFDAFY